MDEVLAKINGIKDTQKTVDGLIELWGKGLKPHLPFTNWDVNILNAKQNCSIGVVNINTVDTGPCESHMHKDSKEFIIVVAGKLLLNIEGTYIRTLTIGDCATINFGQIHYVSALVDNTSFIYICIPEDKGLTKLGEMVTKWETK
jgi:quercetin dioxygenase-like cupin family protein